MLETGLDSAYRRIRGDKTVSFEESVKLCRHFGISLDSFIFGEEKYQFKYDLPPFDTSNIRDYMTYIYEFAAMMDSLIKKSESTIILSAADIPVFYFLEYMDLTLFYLFSWHKNTYKIPENYEEFVKAFNIDELWHYSANIAANYKKIDSFEVWTPNTVDSTIRMLRYHVAMKHFEDDKIPIRFCDQLMDIVNKLQIWMETGKKDREGNPFNFYVNDIDIGNTFILFKKAQNVNCLVKLFSINGLNIKNCQFCQEVENWLHNLIDRSTLISGTSVLERFRFISNQKEKIQTFRDSL